MSRIGIIPITLPKEVKFSKNDDMLIFEKGTEKNELKVPKGIDVIVNESIINVKPIGNLADKKLKSNWGTINRLINNSINGLISPFERRIKLSGTGYKVELQGDILKFQVGYSHDVFVPVLKGVNTLVEGRTTIILKSISKELVGRLAYHICKIKKYNPYKGKGVMDTQRFYRRKNIVKR